MPKLKIVGEKQIGKKGDFVPAIESGITLPPKGTAGGRQKSAIYEMKVGDSFLCPPGINPAWVGLRWAYQKYGFRFSQRQQPDGSIRVWRVK